MSDSSGSETDVEILIPLINLPKPIVHICQLTEEAQRTLFYALMFLPFKMIQLVPPLHTYSLSELNFYSRELLRNPPMINCENTLPDFARVPFTTNEDFAIVTMLRKNAGPFSFEFFQYFSYMFLPIRTAMQITERIEAIQQMTKEERDEICNRFMEETFRDYLAFESMNKDENMEDANLTNRNLENFICVKDEIPGFPILPELNNEINLLSSHRLMFIKDQFSINDLALIRGETYQFYMKQTALIIGRSTDNVIVDIDLGYFIPHSCHHVSKRQAVISFQKDFCFYLENIGKRPFRVNGVLIPKGKVCILQPGAILDFSDILFIFIPNEVLVDRIRKLIASSSPNKISLKKKRK